MCETAPMKGGEFLRRLRVLARRRNLHYRFVPARGKGSHGTVYFGAAITVVKDRNKEIGAGLLHAMCKDLGIDPREL
jgi:mRNA interferase HicA